jgi:hypothetical protein
MSFSNEFKNIVNMPFIQDWMENVKEGLKCYMYHKAPTI